MRGKTIVKVFMCEVKTIVKVVVFYTSLCCKENIKQQNIRQIILLHIHPLCLTEHTNALFIKTTGAQFRF